MQLAIAGNCGRANGKFIEILKSSPWSVDDYMHLETQSIIITEPSHCRAHYSMYPKFLRWSSSMPSSLFERMPCRSPESPLLSFFA